MRLPERITDPIKIPASLWERPETMAALGSRDMQRLFHLLRQYAGASQTRLAIACGLTQGKVSAIMSGNHRVTAFEVFERIADGLQMPPAARLAVGLAPAALGAGSLSDSPSCDLATAGPARFGALAPMVDSPGPAESEDPVRRRTFTRLAGVSLVGAFLAETPATSRVMTGTEELATLLATDHGRPAGPLVADLGSLAKVVTDAKMAYQACRYSEAMARLPGLLPDLQAACESQTGEDRLRAHGLAADAYHVAASILLKLDDHGMAWLAADRSMRAATLSEDPLIIGSAARIITHALTADRHYTAATTTAGRFAQRLATEVQKPTPQSLSVYGSLLLRGAIAAAHAEDRGASMTMLDEAAQAGSRLGSDYNHRWTAFGPVNVLLHRINVAVRLGDAGAAIDYARKVDLGKLPITERKAAFFVDTAQAFTQWGKHEKAYQRCAPPDSSRRRRSGHARPSGTWSATCSRPHRPRYGPTFASSPTSWGFWHDGAR
jgi:hypothetical protein